MSHGLQIIDTSHGNKGWALLVAMSWVLVLAAVPRAQMASAPQAGLTLIQAVDTALANNPMVRVTTAGRAAADAQLAEARTGKKPVVQVSETFTGGNNPVFVFGSLLEQGRFGPNNFNIDALNNPGALGNFRSAVAVRMPVLDQDQTAVRVTQAQLQQQQADKQTEYVGQQIRFNVLRAFYGLLLAQEKKKVAEEAVKLAEADVKRTQDRVDVGTTVASDLLAVQVQLADFRQQLIQSEGEIVTAQAALNTALGQAVDTPVRPFGMLADKSFSITGQDELLRAALSARPDYARAQLAVNTGREQVKGAEGQFKPRAEVYGNFGVSTRAFGGGSSDYTVGASVSFTVFDAGRKARVAQAQAYETLAEAQRETLAQQIRFEVVQSYQQFLSARGRVKVAAQSITQATEALRIVQDRYGVGLTTITEVLRAETALVRARLNLAAARYDHYVGYAGILLATGQLTDVRPFV